MMQLITYHWSHVVLISGFYASAQIIAGFTWVASTRLFASRAGTDAAGVTGQRNDGQSSTVACYIWIKVKCFVNCQLCHGDVIISNTEIY